MALLCSAAGFTLYLWPYHEGQLVLSGDLGWYMLPSRAFYARCLQEGTSFWWCPDLFCGYYLHGEGQVGMLHPLHLALYRVFELPTAFGLENILNYPISWLGMLCFLRRLRLPTAASVLGASIWIMSGFHAAHHVHANALSVVAHLPWLLVGVDVTWHATTKAHRARGALLLAVVTASQLLLGYPQYVWYNALAELAWIGWLLWDTRRLTPLFWVVAGQFAGTLVGAIQIIPTYEALRASARQGSDNTSFRNSYALHPLELLQLWSPYLYAKRTFGARANEFMIYAGAAALPLACFVVRARTRCRRLRIARWWCMFAVCALILSLGSYAGTHLLLEHIPIVGSFRAPARAIVLGHFASATMCAIAFAELMRRSRRAPLASDTRKRMLGGICVATVAVLTAGVGIGAHYFQWWPGRLGAPVAMASGAAVIALAVGLIHLASRGRRLALLGLLILGIAELSAYNLTAIFANPPISFENYLSFKTPPPEPTSMRITYGDNSAMIRGSRLANGYAGLVPKRQLRFFDDEGPTLNALRVASVEWVMLQPGLSSFTDGAMRRGHSWLQVPAPLPRARLLTQTAVIAEGATAARTLVGIDVDHIATVESALKLPPGEAGAAEVRRDEAGTITISTHCTTKQLLVVNESFHSGWRVHIDKQPAVALRAYGDFIGVVVEPGQRVVELRFRPWSLRVGALVAGVGVLLCAMLTALAFRRRRGERRDSDT